MAMLNNQMVTHQATKFLGCQSLGNVHFQAIQAVQAHGCLRASGQNKLAPSREAGDQK